MVYWLAKLKDCSSERAGAGRGYTGNDLYQGLYKQSLPPIYASNLAHFSGSDWKDLGEERRRLEILPPLRLLAGRRIISLKLMLPIPFSPSV